MINTKQDTCSSCGKVFSCYIEVVPTSLDDKRETYYACPYCNAVCGTLLLNGNEEVYTHKLKTKQLSV